jgi:hypothetical protein
MARWRAALVVAPLLAAACACATTPTPETQVHEETMAEFIRRVAPRAAVSCFSGCCTVIGATAEQAREIRARFPHVGVMVLNTDEASDSH